MPLSKETKDLILRTIEERLTKFPRMEIIKTLEQADKAYYMTDMLREDADADSEEDVKSSYEEMGVGVVAPAVEAEVAFLQSIFLSDPRIFSPVSEANKKELAYAVGVKIESDARKSRWATEFMLAFRDSAKYNKMAMYADWIYRTTAGIKVSGVTQDKREADQTTWSGNSIRRIDPYNFVYDHSVNYSQLAEDGEFAGHIELMSQVKLYQHLSNLKKMDSDNGNFATDEEMKLIWNSIAPATDIDHNLSYYEPQNILKDEDHTTEKGTNWLEVAGVEDTSSKIPRAQGYYHVLTLYLRVIPELYKIKSDQQSNGLQIYRLTIVNGKYFLHTKLMENVHASLPYGTSQPTEDSLSHNSRGFSQQLQPTQRLAKELVDRRLASLDRNIEDRAIYNPKYIDGRQFKEKRGHGKFATKQSASEIELDKIYYQIPFVDTTSNLMANELNFVLQNADEISGINKAGRGQFVKGNRTLQEYNDTMSNADAKQYTRAVCIEVQAMSTLKQLLKWNLIQFAENETLLDRKTGKPIEFDSSKVAQGILDFKLADGLNPASKYMNGEELMLMVQMFLQFPEFQQRYDVTEMVSHLLQQTRGLDIEQYEREQPLPAAAPASAASGPTQQ